MALAILARRRAAEAVLRLPHAPGAAVSAWRAYAATERGGNSGGHSGLWNSVRIGGIQLPSNKRLEIALQSIYGIGRTRAGQILSEVNLENKLTRDLSQVEIITLRKEVSKYMIEGDLKRFTRVAIERLEDINCYRGIRHKLALPVRGQRTKTNCRTVKRRRD